MTPLARVFGAFGAMQMLETRAYASSRSDIFPVLFVAHRHREVSFLG
jgi:hypothetical protein